MTVTVNGTGELVGVKIRKDSFDPADTEDLEDLIVAAYRDAAPRPRRWRPRRSARSPAGLGG